MDIAKSKTGRNVRPTSNAQGVLGALIKNVSKEGKEKALLLNSPSNQSVLTIGMTIGIMVTKMDGAMTEIAIQLTDIGTSMETGFVTNILDFY